MPSIGGSACATSANIAATRSRPQRETPRLPGGTAPSVCTSFPGVRHGPPALWLPAPLSDPPAASGLRKCASRKPAHGAIIRGFLAELGRAGAVRPSATGRAGQQATLLPRRLDQVAAAEAVRAVVAVRERVGEMPRGLLRGVWF